MPRRPVKGVGRRPGPLACRRAHTLQEPRQGQRGNEALPRPQFPLGATSACESRSCDTAARHRGHRSDARPDPHAPRGGRGTAGAHASYTPQTSSPILTHFALFYPLY